MQYKKVLLTATCLLSIAGAAMAAPVGMVVKIDGTPSLKTGGKTQNLRKLQRLEPGSTIACGGGESAVVVLFANGERFAIKSNGQGTVQRTSVAGATSLGKLGGASASVARELGGSRAGAIMGRGKLIRQRLSGGKGWLLEGDRVFKWEGIDGAIAYTFALSDTFGNVLWSTPVAAAPVDKNRPTSLVKLPDGTAEYPANLPAPSLRTPYIWRVTGFGSSGKPVNLPPRWGFVTWLSAEDSTELTAAADDLQKVADADPANKSSLILQKAQLFSEYGVYSNTFDIVEASNEPNKEEIIKLTYAELSPFVAYLDQNSKKSEGSIE